MDYLVFKYREKSDEIVDLATTGDPDTAVSLLRRWSQRDPDEGVILVLERKPVVHCAPRGQ